LPKSLPRGLPPSTAGLTTSSGIADERADLRRLHSEGRIDAAGLAAGLEALAMMARMARRRERLAARRR
jgi:hypothetical protein